MAIILILAGLVIAIAGNANNKAARARAEAEIKGMETALESYKADNGVYPTDADTTEKLDAQRQTDPGATSTPNYKDASRFLFKILSGRTDLFTSGSIYKTATPGKSYITFTPSQLSTTTSAQTDATFIVDPFGLSYGYSTIYAFGAAAAAANNTTTPTDKGYNPTYDLWSTSGYGTGGKTYPSDAKFNTPQLKAGLWTKNW